MKGPSEITHTVLNFLWVTNPFGTMTTVVHPPKRKRKHFQTHILSGASQRHASSSTGHYPNLVPQFLDGQTEPEGISHLPRAYIKCQSLCWDSNFSAYTIQPVIKSVLCTSAGCRIPELCPSAWRRTSWCSDKTAADHTLLHRLEPVVHLIWFPHNSLQKPWVSTVIL